MLHPDKMQENNNKFYLDNSYSGFPHNWKNYVNYPRSSCQSRVKVGFFLVQRSEDRFAAW
jgi:hypothetical protein